MMTRSDWRWPSVIGGALSAILLLMVWGWEASMAVGWFAAAGSAFLAARMQQEASNQGANPMLPLGIRAARGIGLVGFLGVCYGTRLSSFEALVAGVLLTYLIVSVLDVYQLYRASQEL